MKHETEHPIKQPLNFGGHHDLGAMAKCAAEKFDMKKEKHADELVLGVRLLHHVLKKYPDNPEFAKFLGQLDDFKDYLKNK